MRSPRVRVSPTHSSSPSPMRYRCRTPMIPSISSGLWSLESTCRTARSLYPSSRACSSRAVTSLWSLGATATCDPMRTPSSRARAGASRPSPSRDASAAVQMIATAAAGYRVRLALTAVTRRAQTAPAHLARVLPARVVVRRRLRPPRRRRDAGRRVLARWQLHCPGLRRLSPAAPRGFGQAEAVTTVTKPLHFSYNRYGPLHLFVGPDPTVTDRYVFRKSV